jgi:hypothetical protein
MTNISDSAHLTTTLRQVRSTGLELRRSSTKGCQLVRRTPKRTHCGLVLPFLALWHSVRSRVTHQRTCGHLVQVQKRALIGYDSIYKSVLPHFLRYASPNAVSMGELEQLPASLFRLCEFAESSLHSENPYYNPASLLAQTLDIECERDNIGMFLSIFSCMNSEFKRLLHKKDPCAMLILGYWYAKVCHCKQWYTWRRTYLECQAICTYLLQHFWNDANIVVAARDVQTKCAAEKPWRPSSYVHAEIRTLRSLPI